MSMMQMLPLIDTVTWTCFWLTGLVWCGIALYEVRVWLKQRGK